MVVAEVPILVPEVKLPPKAPAVPIVVKTLIPKTPVVPITRKTLTPEAKTILTVRITKIVLM